MTDEQRLQMITEQLILVRDNLFRGMSKSIQKLQARSINELLELPSHTQSPPAQRKPLTTQEIRKWWASENGLEDCVMSKLDDFEQVVRADEREACALIGDSMDSLQDGAIGKAIRARGNI